MIDEDRAVVEALGRRAQLITRDRKQPVSGLGRLMPKPSALLIEAGIPFGFTFNHFTAAWKRKGRSFNLRCPGTAPHDCRLLRIQRADGIAPLHQGVRESPSQEVQHGRGLRGDHGHAHPIEINCRTGSRLKTVIAGSAGCSYAVHVNRSRRLQRVSHPSPREQSYLWPADRELGSVGRRRCAQ